MGNAHNICSTYLLRNTDINASDDNGCTYGGLHPCVITDDFLCNANDLCGTGYLCDSNKLCNAHNICNTDINASDDNGCTYGGFHFCAITNDDHGQQLRPLIIDFVGRQQAAVMGLHRRFCKPSCNVTSSWDPLTNSSSFDASNIVRLAHG